MAEAEAAGGSSGAAEAVEAAEGTLRHAGEELRRMGVCGGTGGQTTGERARSHTSLSRAPTLPHRFLFAPNISVLTQHASWANWTLVAACVVAFVVLLPFKERYRRTSFDQSDGSLN